MESPRRAAFAFTTLTAATRLWQKPQTSDAVDWRSPSTRDWKGPSAQSWRDRDHGDPTPTLPDQLAGLHDQENRSTTGNPPASSPRPVLNPPWVQALMGFPEGWLDGVEPPSRRLATPSSRRLPKSSRTASAPSSPKRNA